MRIVIATDQFPPNVFGGMATHAINIARFLGVRHEVLVVVLRTARHPDAYVSEPFEVRPLLTKRFPALDFRILEHAAQNFRADVIHACTAGLADRRLATRFPVVTRVVGNDFLRPWCGYNMLFRSLLYRVPGQGIKTAVGKCEMAIRKSRVITSLCASRTVVANSGWTREQLLAEGAPERIIETVVGGVDVQRFQPCSDKEALRRKLGLPAGVPLVMTAGNLIESKNMGTVVRAVAHLAVEFPSLHHVIAGTGPGENALRELATGLGVADRILFVGKLGHTELCKHYQATDLYVLVSREESMGRTYFEAGACGIPVIGGRVGGVPDVIRHGANGFLVDDPEDVRETASCMEKLLCDEALRRRMGQAGLKRAPEEFSWDAVGAGFEELLICAAGGDRTSGAT